MGEVGTTRSGSRASPYVRQPSQVALDEGDGSAQEEASEEDAHGGRDGRAPEVEPADTRLHLCGPLGCLIIDGPVFTPGVEATALVGLDDADELRVEGSVPHLAQHEPALPVGYTLDVFEVAAAEAPDLVPTVTPALAVRVAV